MQIHTAHTTYIAKAVKADIETKSLFKECNFIELQRAL